MINNKTETNTRLPKTYYICPKCHITDFFYTNLQRFCEECSAPLENFIALSEDLKTRILFHNRNGIHMKKKEERRKW